MLSWVSRVKGGVILGTGLVLHTGSRDWTDFGPSSSGSAGVTPISVYAQVRVYDRWSGGGWETQSVKGFQTGRAVISHDYECFITPHLSQLLPFLLSSRMSRLS